MVLPLCQDYNELNKQNAIGFEIKPKTRCFI